jgi:PAS domain S-box-containing protein
MLVSDQMIIQASPLPIIVLAQDGRISLWNPAAERLFGWRESEVLGRSIPIVLTETDQDFITLLQAATTEQASIAFQGSCYTKDGLPIHFCLWAAPLPNTSGYTSRVILIVTPLTPPENALLGKIHLLTDQDRVQSAQTEATLYEVKQELEQTVQERTNELSNAISLLSLANSQLRQELVKRKQAEAALGKNQERYALAVSGGKVGVWDWNNRTQELYLDPILKAMLGYAEGEISNLEVWTQLCHPDDQEPIKLAAQAHWQGLTPELVSEHRMLHKDGTICWFLVRGTIIRDTDGHPYRITGTATDITERKRAEDTIKQQAEWERLLGIITHHIRQSLNLGQILTTTVTEVRQLLQADRSIVFRIGADGVGRTIAEAVAPGQVRIIEREFLDEVFPQECYEFYSQGNVRIVPDIQKDEIAPCLIEFFQELGVKSKLVVPIVQNSALWGILSVHYCTEPPRHWQEWEIGLLQRLSDQVAIAIQQAELYQQVQIELIERKRVEQELRTSQQRQAFLLRSVPVILYTACPCHHCYTTWISENIELVSGFPSHRFMDEPSFWLSRLHPDDQKWLLQDFQSQLNQGVELVCEYRWQCADGSYRWFLDRAVVIRDEDGKPKELIGTWLDITQRKQAEQEVHKALEQEKELNELKSRFINMASHEFRTPLSTILSSADLLEYYIEEGTADKQLEHIHRIQSACMTMSELLSDILVIGRAEAGKLEFKPSPLDLVYFCGDLMEEMKLSVDCKHQLTFVNQAPYVSAYMDEKLLRHILTNLLSNAIKYSPTGGKIQLKLMCQNEAAIFQIQDEGIGIPSEDQPYVFESFHRAKNVGYIPGTGLGLAIVKRSVDLHGGQIAIASEVGVSTTVTVTLPLNRCSQRDEKDSGD